MTKRDFVPYRNRVGKGQLPAVAILGVKQAFVMVERELTQEEHERVTSELARFFGQRSFSDKGESVK